MQRFLTFTYMRWGLHPAVAGLTAMITQGVIWVVLAVALALPFIV